MRTITDWKGVKATYEAVKECRGGTILADMETGEVSFEATSDGNVYGITETTVEVMSLDWEECERLLEPDMWLALGRAEGEWAARKELEPRLDVAWYNEDLYEETLSAAKETASEVRDLLNAGKTEEARDRMDGLLALFDPEYYQQALEAHKRLKEVRKMAEGFKAYYRDRPGNSILPESAMGRAKFLKPAGAEA